MKAAQVGARLSEVFEAEAPARSHSSSRFAMQLSIKTKLSAAITALTLCVMAVGACGFVALRSVTERIDRVAFAPDTLRRVPAASIGRRRNGAHDLALLLRDVAEAVRLAAVEIITIAGLQHGRSAGHRDLDRAADDQPAFLRRM